jgi:hypothetical protein
MPLASFGFEQLRQLPFGSGRAISLARRDRGDLGSFYRAAALQPLSGPDDSRNGLYVQATDKG